MFLFTSFLLFHQDCFGVVSQERFNSFIYLCFRRHLYQSGEEQANSIHWNFSSKHSVEGKNHCFTSTQKRTQSDRQIIFFFVPHLRIFTFFPRKLISFCIDFFAIQITNSPCHFYLSSSVVFRWRREEDEVPNGHFKSQGSLIAGFLCEGTVWQSRTGEVIMS